MAGVTGRVAMMQGLRRHVLTVDKVLKDEVYDAAFAAAEAGRQTAREVVLTTPSSLSRFPKNNRVWTSAMLQALDADVKKRGTTTTVRAGWLTKKEDYFLIQEHGGPGPGDRPITAMNALSQAGEAMRAVLRDRGIK